MKSLLVVMAAVFGSQVIAQDEITLSIGNVPPPLSYSKWLKGTPVTSFKQDHLYVLEFWATWCGPCIAAMPHLSELANKYAKEATFIGADVYEKTGDKPYESCLPDVTRFVNSSGGRMSYNVIADNNAQDMANKWLKPAGITGIPTTFAVYNGKIVWIGYPSGLDSIIDPVLAGTFDVAAFKKQYEIGAKSKLNRNNEIRQAYKAVQEATAAKDFEKAFQLIDEGIQKVPILNLALRAEKFNILLNNFPESQALEYGRLLTKVDNSLAVKNAITIIEKNGLSQEAYRTAAQWIQGVPDANSFILNKLAFAQSKAEDLKAAIETQQKAIERAKLEVKDPRYAGQVFDYTITDYEARMKEYQHKLKSN